MARDVYGLIGYPLGHSFSRAFFTEKFQREGIDAEYRNFQIESADELLDIVGSTPNLRGLNCTIPHKQAIIPLLDELSREAREIGAVNVIKVSEGGRLKGFNSDIIGFMESIGPLLKPHHRRALVLGTGGASKAVCAGLERLGLSWRYVSRTPREGHFVYADVSRGLLCDYEVVVNCSPIGMFPRVDECPAIPYQHITDRHLLYDLVYNPEETKFLRLGRQRGAVVKGGLEMLHLQAEASWVFWNE